MSTDTTAPRLLVIDDEESICLGFRRFFERRGWRVDSAPSASVGREAFRLRRPDVVFLDVRLGDADGLSLLGEFKAIDPDVPVIVITAYGGLETVVGSMEADAFDYLPKPIDLDLAHRRALRATGGEESCESTPFRPRSRTSSRPGAGLVGSCPAMQEVYKRIAVLARNECTVLIGGQTGTGKELVARAIHRHSPRRDGPFVAVNCGALPEGLVASELFGHVRGAFTGADEDRAGKLEVANGGTLLLDEIGELPAAAQVKLLRAVDQRTIERVGSTRPVALDVRLIAATHRDLPRDVQTGRFRSDLSSAWPSRR
jgi:DNA-binding NtrC family response regulator